MLPIKDKLFPDMGSTGNSAACMNESEFRKAVREALDLGWDARDEQILAEVKKLKGVPPPR